MGCDILNDEHDLSDVLPRFEHGMRLGRPLEGNRGVDDGTHVAALDAWPHVLEQGARNGALLLRRARPQRRARGWGVPILAALVAVVCVLLFRRSVGP